MVEGAALETVLRVGRLLGVKSLIYKGFKIRIFVNFNFSRVFFSPISKIGEKIIYQEGCPRGRRCGTRNAVFRNRNLGFESLTLRQKALKHKRFGAFLFYTKLSEQPTGCRIFGKDLFHSPVLFDDGFRKIENTVHQISGRDF